MLKYDYIQEELSKLLKNKPGNSRERDEYEAAILSVKSIVSVNRKRKAPNALLIHDLDQKIAGAKERNVNEYYIQGLKDGLSIVQEHSK